MTTYALIFVFVISPAGDRWTMISPGYPDLQACREDAGRLAARVRPKAIEDIGCESQDGKRTFYAPIEWKDER